jgi:hypothetical protein
MIYTIGHKTNYLKAIAENGQISKTGYTTMATQRKYWSEPMWLDEDYEGGYAFKTQEDAQRRINEAYLDRGFGVFGLDADWSDTYSKGDYWNYLVESAWIIVLEDDNV